MTTFVFDSTKPLYLTLYKKGEPLKHVRVTVVKSQLEEYVKAMWPGWTINKTTRKPYRPDEPKKGQQA